MHVSCKLKCPCKDPTCICLVAPTIMPCKSIDFQFPWMCVNARIRWQYM